MIDQRAFSLRPSLHHPALSLYLILSAITCYTAPAASLCHHRLSSASITLSAARCCYHLCSHLLLPPPAAPSLPPPLPPPSAIIAVTSSLLATAAATAFAAAAVTGDPTTIGPQLVVLVLVRWYAGGVAGVLAPCYRLQGSIDHHFRLRL
jgi:hypothetical protein